MRPGLERVRTRDHDRRGGERQQCRRHGEDEQHHELHLGGLDLLAEVLGCSPDHETGDEDREERVDEQTHQADTDAAR